MRAAALFLATALFAVPAFAQLPSTCIVCSRNTCGDYLEVKGWEHLKELHAKLRQSSSPGEFNQIEKEMLDFLNKEKERTESHPYYFKILPGDPACMP